MSELVADCPRCGSKKITFRVIADHQVALRYDWQHIFEAFCICKACHRSTIFILVQSEIGFTKLLTKGVAHLDGAINALVRIDDYVSLKDRDSTPPPEYLPDAIAAAFKEGAACFSISCYNAAATMFRLCLDLATKELLPTEETAGLSSKTRRDLGLRLQWLFEQNVLPEGLHDLSVCIKQDGNDGAHDGSLTEHDAHDILDFAFLLLERLYTEPKRIEDARARQLARRNR